jgi:DNA polymerase delta subunit 1
MQKPTPSSKTGIMAFAVKKLKCMVCKTPLDESKGEATVCSHHAGREAEVYLRQLGLVKEHEGKFSELWTQCQRCQGSLHQDVLCTSRDCPIFYMRKKVQKDLKDVTDELARFDINW